MRDIECILLSIVLEKDEQGNVKYDENNNKKHKTVEKPIPIISEEDVYAKEYYMANERGYKPNLRLRISALNYNNEQDLIYMNQKYSVLRADTPNADEKVLVCERKIGDVKQNKHR